MKHGNFLPQNNVLENSKYNQLYNEIQQTDGIGKDKHKHIL